MNPVDFDSDPRETPPFDAPLFDFFAVSGASAVHAHGSAATECLLEWLEPKPADKILEIGCGSGHSLAIIQGRFGSSLTGIDANPSMMRTCRRRLHACGIAHRVELLQVDATRPLPIEDEVFDKIYCESVMAFQAPNRLASLLSELHRVLRPGGRFVANETLWLPETDDDVIARWNRECVKRFGMIQAAPNLKGPASIEPILSAAGFYPGSFRAVRLSGAADAGGRPLVQPTQPTGQVPSPDNSVERRSVWYSRWRRIQSGLSPAHLLQWWRLRKRRQKMGRSPQLMDGWLVMVEKR